MKKNRKTCTLLMMLPAMLAACTPAGPQPPQALNCRGNEPFWSLQLRGDDGTLQWLTHEIETRQYTGAWSGATTWAGEDTASRLHVQLRAETCLDSMNDETPPSPWHVQLRLPDGQIGPGCCTVPVTP